MRYTEIMTEIGFEREKTLRELGLFPIGIDEAGRGPLAGSVVAAATLLRDFNIDEENPLWKLVRDSKKLSPKQRETAFEFVEQHFWVGVGVIGPETIDRVNILEATFLAMKAAVADLRRIMKQELGIKKDEELFLLVDGNQTIPNLSLQQETIVDGDSLVKSIAAASIIAKVTRDRMIVEADALYPGYGFAAHKGYGTKVHMEALRKFGPSPIHRMSFEPVRMSLPENVNRKLSTLNTKRTRGIAKKPKAW